MGYRSYEWKIIYVLIVVFALIQAGVFVGLSRQNEKIARETLELELETGAEVLNRLLRLRHRQLEQSARVLGADLELRNAIMRDDLATARTLLEQHEGRIAAAAIVVTNPEDRVLITIDSPNEPLDPRDVRVSASEYAQNAHAPLVDLINTNSDLIYQVITIPVSSTLPVAWLTIGYPLADSLVQTLNSVANTQYAFLSHRPAGDWREHGSTFPTEEMRALLPQFSRDSSESQTLSGNGDDFMVMPFALSRFADLELVAMVGKSLDQAMRPFDQLQRNLLVWVIAGSLISAVAIFLITRRMVGPLNTMAHVDALTGLPNRRVFDIAINKLSSTGEAVVKPSVPPFGVMLMDMEGFSDVNSAMGHTAGDQVLRVISERLRDTLRKSDLISRYGGDEFAVLMPNVDRQSCTKVAEMILESLERRIPVEGRDVEIGISIGIAMSPDDGRDRATLLRKADLAMHAAKKSGRGFAFFQSDSMHD